MISLAQQLILAALVLGDACLGLIAIWKLPDRVPVHWNFQGEVDRYGSPWELGFLVPIGLTLLTALLVLLPHLGSLGQALSRSGNVYGRIAICIVLVMVAIHAATVVLGRPNPLDAVRTIWIIFGLMWMTIGNWLGKIRRNALMGIRTPWTLQSDFVWERTHRIGGRLEVAHGLAILLAGFFLPVWAAPAVFLVGVLGLVIWALFYSWSLGRAEARDGDPTLRKTTR